MPFADIIVVVMVRVRHVRHASLMSAQYNSSGANKGTSANCVDAAFFNSNDNWVQVGCETNDVSPNHPFAKLVMNEL